MLFMRLLRWVQSLLRRSASGLDGDAKRIWFLHLGIAAGLAIVVLAKLVQRLA